ncbi:MAG TPA: Gfo/Idh/MocA family oxidoreductase [Rudaea sp.]|nr:Gfo/Idh/MocA family oxidoreductase [Rudaea sp.]
MAAPKKPPAKTTIRMALVGPGFIAAHHIDAVRRLGNVEVVAIAGSSVESARRKAREWHIGRACADYRELTDDPGIDVIHNTTPNHLHFDVSMAALRAGKHVVADKPLAMNAEQCRQLHDAALRAGVAHVVTFNYRGNPLVQHARALVAQGGMGKVTYVHGQYLQDWLADDSVYSWRLDPRKSGASSALLDIGSHWCDLAEHVSGLRIASVLADLTTVVPVRYRTSPAGKRQRVKVTSEDLANVLLRFDNGARGCLRVGQVLPGHKNDLQLEVNGRTASLRWLQERQNELWIGRYAQPDSVIVKDPALLAGDARRYAHLPAGHQEAWSDAFFNLIADAYEWIAQGGAAKAKPATLPTFADGYRSARLIEAMLRSHADGGVWIQPAEPAKRERKP